MATGNLKNFCIEMEIPEISKLENFWSPEIPIHGIPWNVKVCKKGKDAEQSLGVYLYCENMDKSPNWSLWGAASVKLLPFSDDANPIEQHNDPDVFDASGSGYGTPNLIKWNDLFNPSRKFVKEDTINLEIKVTAQNPNDPNRSCLDLKYLHKCCDNCHLAAFRLTVTNVFNLMAMQSPQFILRGLPWRIHVFKSRLSQLGVMLRLKKDAKIELNEMKMTIKLISSKKDVQPIKKCITKQHEHLKKLYARDVVSWDELLKPENGFVNFKRV